METMRRFSRRTFIAWVGGAGAGFYLFGRVPGMRVPVALAQLPGGTLDPTLIPKFETSMLIPPVMPRAATLRMPGGKPVDYYEISMRQFAQQILPAGLPATTVWGYGGKSAQSNRGLLIHNAPSLTIEAEWNRPVRVKWINELVDGSGDFLPHLLPVDPTLHWANPPGGELHRDMRPEFDETPGRYTGPVPIVTHVHGAVGVADDSDGYAEAWYLPDTDVPEGYATHGTWYEFFAGKAAAAYGVTWGPGFATFQYPNHNRASTIWYHDHALGMTRLNVYAGPAGFYLVRGGPSGDKAVLDSRTGTTATLPGPAPRENDKFPPNKPYREIPIAIQDRAFNLDGSLFYPDSREVFDEIVGPFIPEEDGFSPIWNPEFFGNTIMVNGNTWPFLNVEQRRYRLRFLNGCQSRFLILDFNGIPGVEAWQIGNEGGFLAAPVNLTALGNRLLMGLAERADVIVDFTNVAPGSYVLANVGPDEPFGGGEPPDDFDVADPDTTGQVLQFRVVPALDADVTTPPQFLQLPAITPLPAATATRPLALIEKAGEGFDANGDPVEGPLEALLGNVESGLTVEKLWMDSVSENPAVGATEVWEFYNTTADAHPMHVHEVVFEVVNRQALVLDGEEVVQPIELDGDPIPPEAWESGFKDTVIAYPGQVTRVRARFVTPGQFVWHCHIVEHEDNEMMRPYRIGPMQPGQPE
ncbi:MAG TPA: multicopper oxidase domain-containing protein [Gaiellaceae bacterium]|nr:multicopper oxidase domain-containing protein [Gaiellaceae bacterium]